MNCVDKPHALTQSKQVAVGELSTFDDNHFDENCPDGFELHNGLCRGKVHAKVEYYYS